MIAGDDSGTNKFGPGGDPGEVWFSVTILMLEKKQTMLLKKIACLVAVALVIVVSSTRAETPYEIDWMAQLGSDNTEYSYSIAVDSSGNTFISGFTKGLLGSQSYGDYDAFLAKYNTSGTLLWKEQLGTSEYDQCRSVTVDSFGNAFITGYTKGVLDNDGHVNVGGYDAFLAKYNVSSDTTSGAPLWIRQWGSNVDDSCRSVAVDAAGNAFIAGYTQGALYGSSAGGTDAFLAKFDTSGTPVWEVQMGTGFTDYCESVAVDASGNVFIGGSTNGVMGVSNAGGYDAFLAKYDASGTLTWTVQLGSSADDKCESVAVDASGNVFVAGSTKGNLDGTNAGGTDAFLAKYDTSGELLWKEQWGTSKSDTGYSVAVDADGNAFLAGLSSRSGPAGNSEAFLAMYDASGEQLWVEQLGELGSSRRDYCYSAVVDADGNAFIGGYAQGSLCGPSAGSYDAFLIKFSPVPEPGSLVMLAGIALMGLLCYAWRKRK